MNLNLNISTPRSILPNFLDVISSLLSNKYSTVKMKLQMLWDLKNRGPLPPNLPKSWPINLQ